MKKFTFLLFVVAMFSSLSLTASITDPVAKPVAEAASKEVILDDVVTADAMREFKSLSRVDRKMRLANVKAAIKEYKAQRAVAATPSTNTLLLVILALLLPPLAVYLHEGQINGKFWLNLLLTLLFFIPGVIHALIVVLG